MSKRTLAAAASAVAASSRSPAFWLLKSEPSDYSIAMMQSEQRTVWDGVRNPVARKNLRAMEVGDLCLFYHSSCGKQTGIAGLVSVVRKAYEDPLDSKWSVVDVEYRETWQPSLPLEAIKAHAAGGSTLDGLILLRQPRLSVQPVSEPHFRVLNDLYQQLQGGEGEEDADGGGGGAGGAGGAAASAASGSTATGRGASAADTCTPASGARVPDLKPEKAEKSGIRTLTTHSRHPSHLSHDSQKHGSKHRYQRVALRRSLSLRSTLRASGSPRRSRAELGRARSLSLSPGSRESWHLPLFARSPLAVCPALPLTLIRRPFAPPSYPYICTARTARRGGAARPARPCRLRHELPHHDVAIHAAREK